ncbi:MAG: hypothetical protein JXA60_05525, partial [Candidatus Coatesbacteria bacterium]|nr:hypothetical protein [Candidatus Coatesbacteria bacterium]
HFSATDKQTEKDNKKQDTSLCKADELKVVEYSIISNNMGDKNLLSFSQKIWSTETPIKNKLFLKFIKDRNYYLAEDPRLVEIKENPDMICLNISGIDADNICLWLNARLPKPEECRSILSKARQEEDFKGLFFWCREGKEYFLFNPKTNSISKVYPDLQYKKYTFLPVWEKKPDVQ